MAGLANYKVQLALIHKALAELNPLRADLRLPPLPEVPDPLAHYRSTGNTQKDGDARHNAAIQLRTYLMGLKRQIAEAKQAIKSGGGIGAATLDSFFAATGDGPRTPATASFASLAPRGTRERADSSRPPASDLEIAGNVGKSALLDLVLIGIVYLLLFK